jgi:flagellar biosynthetic protein FlhB
MSDEDLEDKTEDPSERRKRESRAKGHIVRSKELTNLIALLGSAIVLKSYGKKLTNDLKHMFHESMSFSADVFKDDYYIVKYFKDIIITISFSILPFLLLIVVMTVAGGFVVGGLNFSFSSIGLKFERLNPWAGLKKIFSKKIVMEVIKSLMKFALLAIAFYIVVKKSLAKIVSLDELDVIVGIDISINLFLWTFLVVCLPLVLVVLIDVPYQMWTSNQQMKMTKQEVKDESKDSDGNPQIKSRMRKLQYEISKRKMMQELPSADVVITNPEHFAVALKYDPKQPGAPVVIAKGLDLIAQLIKKVAAGHKIPVIEAPSVARSLYYNVEIGAEIPAGLYIAVAKVLTYIHELNLYQKGKMNKPKLKNDFQIPNELVR